MMEERYMRKFTGMMLSSLLLVCCMASCISKSYDYDRSSSLVKVADSYGQVSLADAAYSFTVVRYIDRWIKGEIGYDKIKAYIGAADYGSGTYYVSVLEGKVITGGEPLDKVGTAWSIDGESGSMVVKCVGENKWEISIVRDGLSFRTSLEIDEEKEGTTVSRISTWGTATDGDFTAECCSGAVTARVMEGGGGLDADIWGIFEMDTLRSGELLDKVVLDYRGRYYYESTVTEYE